MFQALLFLFLTLRRPSEHFDESRRKLHLQFASESWPKRTRFLPRRRSFFADRNKFLKSATNELRKRNREGIGNGEEEEQRLLGQG